MSTPPSTDGSGIRIDPGVLRDVRHDLLREQQRLGPGRVEPPDTGPTTDLTAAALAGVAAAVTSVGDDLARTAATLARLLDDLDTQDDRVGSAFARLRAEVGR